jgi:hypothetical protein
MKAKTFVACAFAASALPFSSGWATMPTGPQGTGAYGAANAAVPLPQTVPPGHVYPGPYVEQTVSPLPDSSVNRDALADQTALDRDPPRADDGRRIHRRWVHQGPSWATNPPAPPG